MGRMGGGGAAGSAQGNQSGSDSKDIRRRVSHNEGEFSAIHRCITISRH